tara:strand:- start:4038 stop:4544 length:507 start_codon:yes stop_codon:yes gene_type:complete
MKLDFCVACGTRENLIYHHLKPKVYGGEDNEDNLLTLCQYHHGIIHSYEWRGNLSELIKHGQAKAKADGKRVHGTPEEMEKLNENQRQEWIKYCCRLKPFLIPGISRREQAEIWQTRGFRRFKKYKGKEGTWDESNVRDVIKCLETNNLLGDNYERYENERHGKKVFA